MKKAFITVAFLATMFTSIAQENQNKINFGLKGGLNNSNASTKESIIANSKSKIGIHFGVFTSIPMGKTFVFQPELLYSMQGAKTEYTKSYYTQVANTKLNYLSLPLNFQCKLFRKAYIETGPFFDFLLSAKGDITRNNHMFMDDSVVEQKNVDLKDNHRSMSFGLNFGGGYHVSDKIVIGARYSLSLPPATKDASHYTFYDTTPSPINKLFQLSVGYVFK